MNVEIWSDIACPWCYVGKRRFEAALAGFEHRDDVTVTWRSFELDPGAPRERARRRRDAPRREVRDEPSSRRVAMQDRMTRRAAERRASTSASTSPAPATRSTPTGSCTSPPRTGVQDAMKERLMRAYLTEGEPIGDPAALERLAVEAGLPADEVRDLLAGDRFADEVREDERTAARFGIHAVPFFVVDRALGASGAQPPEVLGELLRRGWEARQPAVQVVADGEACGPDGC